MPAQPASARSGRRRPRYRRSRSAAARARGACGSASTRQARRRGAAAASAAASARSGGGRRRARTLDRAPAPPPSRRGARAAGASRGLAAAASTSALVRCRRRPGARTPPGAAGRCSCPTAPRARAAIERFYRRAARGEIARRLDEAIRARSLHAPVDPKSADPLGELREQRRDELQLAADARARAGARLRRLARGLPPARWPRTRRTSGRCSNRARRAGASRLHWLREHGRALAP